MAEEGKSDAQLFQLLSNLLQQDLLEVYATELPSESKKVLKERHRTKPYIGAGFRGMFVEAQSNEEEVELRSKIEALGLEVAKLPSKSTNNLDELEIARELDKLSAKLDDVDEMISSALASDPQVQSLLSDTADVWMPVITANADERRNFTASVGNDKSEEKGENPK